MGKTLYFDCFSGASGDMIVGALLDLGLPLDGLRAALGSLAIDHVEVSAARVLRAGVSATKFTVEADRSESSGGDPVHAGEVARAHAHAHGHREHHRHAHHGHHGGGPELGKAGHTHGPHAPSVHSHGHHSLRDIAGAIGRSGLSAEGKDRALHLFHRLAEAEAAIHDLPLDAVHLHEVGAVDSIVDIVAAVYGLEWTGAGAVHASALNVGSGTVECAHGTFPVPAPATARLLQGVPVYGGPVVGEMVTPTGALIVTDYATSYGPLPPLSIDAIGYGAGSRDITGHPNVLRLLLGDDRSPADAGRIVTIECEIDDMNPQLFGPLMDRLAARGALDVFYAPVQMKKNRPGTLVTVVARPQDREAITAVLFSDTTTIGVRYHEMLRDVLDREIVAIETPVGPIRFKVASRGGRVLNASPEFDDCARASAERGLPIKDVQALAVKAWLETTTR